MSIAVDNAKELLDADLEDHVREALEDLLNHIKDLEDEIEGLHEDAAGASI